MATLKKTPAAQTILAASFTYEPALDSMLNTATPQVLTSFGKVTSGGDTTFDVINIPHGAQVVGGDVVVITAVTGPTVSTVSVGDSASATRYAATVNQLAAARTALTITGYQSLGESLRLTINNTVAAATAGKVKITLNMIYSARATENLKTV